MLVSVVLICVCLLFVILQLKPKRPKNFPPGPAVLPVLGNLLELNLDNPLQDFERLRKTYGNVYSLFLGTKPAVVLSSSKAIKEALVTKANDFAGRPRDLFISDVTLNRGVILADFGSCWREHRRFALTTLRNFGLGKMSMEQRIFNELEFTMEKLEGSVGRTLSPEVMFHNLSSNIICQVLFGRRYEYDDAFIRVIIRCFTENAKMTNGPWAVLYDSFPLVRKLPLPFVKAFDNVKTVQSLVLRLLDEHKRTREPGRPRDFIDCYLDEMLKRGDDGSEFSENQLLMFSLDLYFAGTDTTSNTLLTGFLHLMDKPHVQERCQQEIDRALEGKAQVSYDDRNNMPYVQAVIHEIQRVSNTVPLSVVHSTTRDTELRGFSIPKGTMVIPNLGSALADEDQWKHPHEFNPDNFLTPQGQFVKPDAFLPFSTGVRACLGEGLARMELFLIVVTMLRRFRFVWPEEDGDPDFAPVYGVTLTPRPYRMKVQLRTDQ